MTDLRYPIGPHDPTAEIAEPQLRRAARDIRELPEKLAEAVGGLSEEQLDTPYRPEGWTVRQVVHHLADSHLNAHQRTRLALTVERPTVVAYDEKLWAELPDARSGPVEPSMALLRGVHARWSALLDGLGEAELRRPLDHPELGEITLAQLVGLYGWHSRHHVAHVTSLRQRSGW